MVRTMPWKMALLAVGAVAGFASSAGQTFAQESEGIVRITDHAGQNGPTPISNDGGGYVEGGCPNCESGAACGYHGCNMRPMGYVGHIVAWANPWSGVGTYSPDHGYAPPGKVRTPHPQQVAYTKAFPDAWTGQPGAGGGGQQAQHIYMPTDTTQLGYYYQATPRWHANPNMIPPTPVPSQWHRDLCQGCQDGRCQLGAGHFGGGHLGGGLLGGGRIGGGRLRHGRFARGGSCPSEYCGEQIISEQVIDNSSQPSMSSPTPAVDVVPTEIHQDPAPPSIPAPIQHHIPPTTTPMTPPAVPLEKAAYPNLRPIR